MTTMPKPAADVRPWAARSLLFVPGDSPRKLEKALAGEADLIILDLEDSVAENAKQGARDHVAALSLHHSPSSPGWRFRPRPTRPG